MTPARSRCWAHNTPHNTQQAPEKSGASEFKRGDMTASDALRAIKSLHTPSAGHNPQCNCGIKPGAGARCQECLKTWPCPTIQTINNQQPPVSPLATSRSASETR